MSRAPGAKDRTRNLPEGWRWVRLGEACEVIGGSTPDTGNPGYWDGEVVWVTPTDLGKLCGMSIETSGRRITSAGFSSCGTQLLSIGTVVMSSRAPIGHLAMAAVSLCTNQGCKSFVPGPRVDSTFLYWALKEAVPDIQALGSGATFLEVSKSALQQFAIPLPPLAEQRRIAAVLREQMAAVERVRAAAQARLEAIQRLPSAYYRQVFGEKPPFSAAPVIPTRATLPGWHWRRLTDLARLATGHTPSRRHPEYWRGDVPWIQLADIRALDGQEAFGTLEQTNQSGIENSAAVLLPKGTVCMSRTASVGFFTIMGRPMATSQDFVNWVCNDHLDPWFLMYLFTSCRREIRDLGSGAVHQTIYFPTVKSFSVCVPELTEQQRIASFLRSQARSVAQARAAAEEELNTINALPGALLRRAFNGEI